MNDALMSPDNRSYCTASYNAEKGTITVELADPGRTDGLDFRFRLGGQDANIGSISIFPLIENCLYVPFRAEVQGHRSRIMILTYTHCDSDKLADSRRRLVNRINDTCGARESLYYRVGSTGQVVRHGERAPGDEVRDWDSVPALLG